MSSLKSRGFFSEAWSLGSAVLRAMRITGMNLFRKPVTVHYPEKPRTYPDRYRGLLALTYDKETGAENCIGCRLCEFICPPAVIKVEMLKGQGRNFAKSFQLEMYACEFCELCVQVCPTDAIVMTKSSDMATSDRRNLLLDKDRLHVLGLQHEVSWGVGTKLRDMQNPPKKAAGAEGGEAAKPAAEAGKPAAETPKPAAEAPAAAPAPADKPAGGEA